MSIKLKRARNQSGAALAEGVVSLWLVVVITVAAVSLLTNSGMSIFYKQKISFIAMQTALYTAHLKMNEDKVGKGEAFAKNMITSMGMPARNAEIIVREMNIEDAPSISVKITIANLPLLQGDGGMMPLSVTLGDEAIAIKQQSPEAYVWLNNNPKMSPFLIPVVRMPANGVQGCGLPYVIP